MGILNKFWDNGSSVGQ